MPCRCPLLRLPTELRLRIYEELFDPKCRQINWNTTTIAKNSHEPLYLPCRLLIYNNFVTTPPRVDDRGWNNDFLNFAAVLRTCSFIYHEAVDVLYDHTRFTLSVLRPSNLGGG